jgi:hypothetical protein
MTKQKSSRLLHALPFLLFLSISCGIMETTETTKSGSGSSSVTSKEVPAHGQVTINLLERSPFRGKDLDPAFWSNLESYCKAGPTQLILADMNLVPVQMSRAGFSGRWAAQCYALASTYAGLPWNPAAEDGEALALWNARDQIDAWWSRYIQTVVQIMQKAPQTTALIITNDGFDRLGFRLGDATYRSMGSVAGRVTLGSIYQY